MPGILFKRAISSGAALPPQTVTAPSDTLMNYARMLDMYYTPTRYPNGFESGAPTDFYTLEEAQNAIHQAEAIIEFCHHQID